jgi:GNAT superfamily N-acetyltransferase
MDSEHRIEYVETPTRDEWMTIGGGIAEYNEQHAGDDSSQPLCFVLREPDGTIAGGVIGETHYGWLFVNLMWIKEELRGQGYGSRLLTMAEDEARQRGAGHAYLDTFSFQAPGFYRRCGYEVFGTLEGFPAGHQRYFLVKQL